MDDGTSRALPSPWGEHAIGREEPLALRLGPLALWLKAEAGEVRMAHAAGRRRGTGDEPSRGPPPEDTEWIRWPVPTSTDRVRFFPVLPPRPVVVEPDLSFRLLAGARARVFVRVPLWVRVELEGRPDVGLTEVPSVLLSDTWWGSLADGELCYGLRTTARREVTSEIFSPHLVVCPLQLANGAQTELAVEKIAVRVDHLSLFADEGRLWADVTRVRYRGVEEGSDIEMSGTMPAEAPDAVRVAAPRVPPPPRGFRARTFARLRALSGFQEH